VTTPILKPFLLGKPEFWLNGEILSRPLNRKTLSLLAYLLLHQSITHSREKLAAQFWGEVSDQKARHALRTALASLRKELTPERFITDRKTILSVLPL